jgi:hypothetical protein
LNELHDKLISEAELQDETPDENKAFEEATIGLKTLKSEIEKEDKE